MSNGITTVVSTSPIPERLQENIDRAAEHRHQATSTVVQAQADEKVKTVQKSTKAEALRRKEEKDKKKRDSKQGRGGNLDLEA